MSKKGKNTLFPEKIKGNLFDADNEEDISELKNINSLLSHSKENLLENDDNNNDLNNRTNVSDRDNISENEKKGDTTLKSKENSSEENENDNSELVLKDKNFIVEDMNSQLKSDVENFEINLINKNINLFINEFELNNNKNINIEKQLNNNFDNKDSLLTEKKEAEKENISNEQKKKTPIFFIRKIKKRSKRIQFLRKKKGIHLKRKNNSDIIRKKIKTYFHNYLIDKLNKELKEINNWKKINFNLESHFHSKKVKKKRINKFLKFNNKFTTNVSINLNKKLLLKKISDILIEEPISSKYKSFHIKNNSYLTKYLLSLKSIPNIHKILNSKYEECFKKFLESSFYGKILDEIKKKDGIQYLNNFKKVCSNLTSFYNKEKLKKKEVKKKIFLIEKIKIDKEESKRSKNSKKSKRSISYFHLSKTSNNSSENKFKNLSSIYSIKNDYNIISLSEHFSFININSKEGSESYDKSYTFKYINELSDNFLYKENEENNDDNLINEDKIIDGLNNLSLNFAKKEYEYLTKI